MRRKSQHLPHQERYYRHYLAQHSLSSAFNRARHISFLLSSPPISAAMGLVATLLGPFADRVADTSPILVASAGFFVLLSLVVVLNVLKQLLIKNPNQPPVVFHWFPLIGSTISYGMDPIAFFKSCQDKVCRTPLIFAPAI